VNAAAPATPFSLRRLAGNPWVVLASILAGLAVGQWAPGLAARLGVIGDIYIDLLKMVVLPFMVAAVIFSLRKLLTDKAGAHILPRVLTAFLAAFVLAAVVGLLTALAAAPGRNLSENTLLVMGRLAGAGAFDGSHDSIALFGRGAAAPSQGLGDLVRALVPSNIFASLTHGETLKVLAFSLLFGLAVGRAPDRIADALTHSLETVYRACLKLTQWFNLTLPVVLLAIIASQTARTGLEPLRAMVKFILALGLGSALLVAASLWVLRAVSGRPWTEVLQSQREPLLMAIATRSSSACMPTMIASLVEALGFTRSRIELLVPLGVSLLRIGPVLYYTVATVFIAQLYGVALGPAQLGLVAVAAMLAGFASTGMTGLVTISMTALVCNYLRLPFEAALALFMAVDPLCDMMRTAVLVAGNSAFAAAAAGAPDPAGGEGR
jgi:Na+/H+-dicarboxylate symporter